VPWTETGLTGADYLAAFRWLLLPVLRAFDPCLTLVSAGFDAAAGDPLGGMSLTPAAYGALTEQLCAATTGGRVCVTLEGGYNEDAIAACCEEVLRALMRAAGVSTGEAAATEALRKSAGGKLAASKCRPGTAETLAAVREAHSPHWPCLQEEPLRSEFEAWHAAELARCKVKPGRATPASSGASAVSPVHAAVQERAASPSSCRAEAAASPAESVRSDVQPPPSPQPHAPPLTSSVS